PVGSESIQESSRLKGPPHRTSSVEISTRECFADNGDVWSRVIPSKIPTVQEVQSHRVEPPWGDPEEPCPVGKRARCRVAVRPPHRVPRVARDQRRKRQRRSIDPGGRLHMSGSLVPTLRGELCAADGCKGEHASRRKPCGLIRHSLEGRDKKR